MDQNQTNPITVRKVNCSRLAEANSGHKIKINTVEQIQIYKIVSGVYVDLIVCVNQIETVTLLVSQYMSATTYMDQKQALTDEKITRNDHILPYYKWHAAVVYSLSHY